MISERAGHLRENDNAEKGCPTGHGECNEVDEWTFLIGTAQRGRKHGL